jgi:ferredoxin/flavodoxin---NADP+ reductase
MPAYNTEKVLSVHHWNDSLFSFRTTRPPDLRFHSGHFVMLGMEIEGKPLLRAYSIASAYYDEHLEFLSIKVAQGPLTSRLQHLQPGDAILLSRKPVGTLLIDDLLPGRHVYLLASGTGLAPFLSVIQDPLIYERFEKVVLVHSVRTVSELAYAQWIGDELKRHELVGEQAGRQLLYVPSVTREPFHTAGRITTLIESGRLAQLTGLPQLSPEHDRAMLCGSPAMLADLCALLEQRGLQASAQTGHAGHYVIEKAFAAR